MAIEMDASARFDVVVIAYLSRDPLTSFLESLGTGTPVIVVDNSAETDDLAIYRSDSRM